MAKFMGTVQGDRGKASRLGHRGMVTQCANWAGAIQTIMSEREGVVWVCIEQIQWRGAGDYRVLYEGPLAGMGAATWPGRHYERG